MSRLRVSIAGLGVAAFLAPLTAFAHAFGQQYTLPLPVSLYAAGAAVALVASFVILSFFGHPGAKEGMYERSYALPQWMHSRTTALALRAFGVLVLALTLAAAFFGSHEATKNPALFLFWIGLLLVVAYASSLVAGLWERIDPFRTVAWLIVGRTGRPLLDRYPAWLPYAPAILVYYFILWFELLSLGAGAVPNNVGLFLEGYLVVTLFGVGLFGSDAWFRWGDFFSVFFGVLERFAPFALTDGHLRVSPPGERLLFEEPESPGLLVFILLILASTAYDGLRDTRPWVYVFGSSQVLVDHYALVSLVLLLAAPFVFLALYAFAVYCMQRIVRHHSYLALVLRFGYSLVPVAVAYNVAHYFSLVVSEGQNAIPMLSDPFGIGLNLFGTAGYVYNPGFISAQTIWYTQVGVIVAGHIIATYIAHRIALREFSSRMHVVAGQVPLLLLMVLYTSFGLWILSLPYSI